MDEILLSVIIPAYNCDKYIVDTVQSVIRQPGRGLECIVVDDGSTDQTARLIDELEKKYSNVRAYHKPNEGLCRTKNYGLERAKGKYINFLDSDDVICKNAYTNELADVLSNGEIDIISPSYIVADHDLKWGNVYWRDDHRYLVADAKGKVKPIYHDAFSLVKREVIGDVRFNSYSEYYEDWVFSAMVVYRARTILTVKTPWYIWRMNNKSMSHSYSKDKKNNITHWIGAYVYMMENARNSQEREMAAVSLLQHSYNYIYYRTAYGYPLNETLENYNADENIQLAKSICNRDAMVGLPRYNLMKANTKLYQTMVRLDLLKNNVEKLIVSVPLVRKANQRFRLGFRTRLDQYQYCPVEKTN